MQKLIKLEKLVKFVQKLVKLVSLGVMRLFHFGFELKQIYSVSHINGIRWWPSPKRDWHLWVFLVISPQLPNKKQIKGVQCLFRRLVRHMSFLANNTPTQHYTPIACSSNHYCWCKEIFFFLLQELWSRKDLKLISKPQVIVTHLNRIMY